MKRGISAPPSPRRSLRWAPWAARSSSPTAARATAPWTSPGSTRSRYCSCRTPPSGAAGSVRNWDTRWRAASSCTYSTATWNSTRCCSRRRWRRWTPIRNSVAWADWSKRRAMPATSSGAASGAAPRASPATANGSTWAGCTAPRRCARSGIFPIATCTPTRRWIWGCAWAQPAGRCAASRCAACSTMAAPRATGRCWYAAGAAVTWMAPANCCARPSAAAIFFALLQRNVTCSPDC